jgi:hypothetical protein
MWRLQDGVGRMDKTVQCELCELWFHCKCEGISEDSYKLMGQDKIHFYCGRCDKAAGKILKTVLGIQGRHTKMEGELNKVKGEVEEINKRPYVVQEQLKEVVQHFESEIEDVKKVVLKGSQKAALNFFIVLYLNLRHLDGNALKRILTGVLSSTAFLIFSSDYQRYAPLY